MKVFKKFISLIVLILILATSIYFGTALIKSKTYEPQEVVVERVEQNYDMYIKGTDTIRLSIKENFNTCKSGDKIKRCGIIKNTITNASNLTKKEDLSNYENENAINAIKNIIENIKDNIIIIQTNWNSRFTKEELESLIKTEKKNITVEIKNISIEQNNKETKYTIKLDSKNGKKVKEVIAKKDGKLKKPENPSKKGYIFVEWQLDGKKYDFNKKVKKDFTLVAKWKKKKS